MGVRQRHPDRDEFASFVDDVEPRLLHALVARYGPIDGRAATVDALSWAWEHWDRLASVQNRAGYLYRVGQSASRRLGSRPLPATLQLVVARDQPTIEPELIAALAELPEQQRVVVVLVHAFGWSQTAVADLLGITPSTVHAHLSRAVARLRDDLEERDAS
jgi:DNA-directed RNA polymerase specialized sigma24 family protein